MAPWVACNDWNKGSAQVSGGYLVAVGPASRWDGSTVLRGHPEDLKPAARDALEAQVVSATGVGLGFAAMDEWLAAWLTDPALVKQVLLVQTAGEYQGVVGLMAAEDCVWVQIGKDDWAVDGSLVEAGAWGEALPLVHSLDGSFMSDVEEALARVVGSLAEDGMGTSQHGSRNGATV